MCFLNIEFSKGTRVAWMGRRYLQVWSSWQFFLSSRKISFQGGKYSLIWDGCKSGFYSSGMAYKLIESSLGLSKSPLPNNICWYKFNLPKQNVFTWIVLHNRSLTTNSFMRIAYKGPSWCLPYELEEESIYHLFLKYPFSNYH